MNVRAAPSLHINGIDFIQKFGAESGTYEANFPEFVLVKTDEMLNNYRDRFASKRVDDLLELGILRGGSVAFFNETLMPRRHMAIDIHREAGGLDTYVQTLNKIERDLLVCYDVSQSDCETIKTRYEDHFNLPAGFDLIIDDASHNYALSLASFNGLFPLLRSGGIYAIEDWGWAHWVDGGFQEPENVEFNNMALSNLIIYCVLACTAQTAGIARVDVTLDTVFIHRNEHPLPSNFRIEKSFPARGRSFAL